MPAVERGFHPLSKVEQHPIPRVNIDLNLPEYVDKDKLGINLRAIHGLCRMGGIRELHILGRSGESSSYSPTIVGRGSDGTAYGGLTGKEQKADSYSVRKKNYSDSPFEYGPFSSIDVTLAVNLNEISSKVSETGNLRNPRAWAKELNGPLKQGITEAGVGHVLHMDTFDKGLGLSTLVSAQFAPTGLLFEMPEVLDNPGGRFVLTNSIVNMVLAARFKAEFPNDEFRWSFFTGPQIDRAVILSLMGSSRKLIKELPKK